MLHPTRSSRRSGAEVGRELPARVASELGIKKNRRERGAHDVAEAEAVRRRDARPARSVRGPCARWRESLAAPRAGPNEYPRGIARRRLASAGTMSRLEKIIPLRSSLSRVLPPVHRHEPHRLAPLHARAAHHPQLPIPLQPQLVDRPALQRRAPAQPEPQQAAIRRQLHGPGLPSCRQAGGSRGGQMLQSNPSLPREVQARARR